MKYLALMFSRKWLLTTLLVIAACAVMVRLGIWQLDRLAARRAFNARVLAQQEAPALRLDAAAISLDLFEMEYRSVTARGEYVPEEEVVLRNQVYSGIPGYRLLTPLQIEGAGVWVMVDRGFVPAEEYTPGVWQTYAARGTVDVAGVLRRGQSEPDFGGRPDPTPRPGEALLVWNIANLEQMAAQMSAPLLPVYIQILPPEGAPTGELPSFPAPFAQDLELTEGPHLGYAVQWFLFASVLAFGYPFFIRRETAAGSEVSAPAAGDPNQP